MGLEELTKRIEALEAEVNFLKQMSGLVVPSVFPDEKEEVPEGGYAIYENHQTKDGDRWGSWIENNFVPSYELDFYHNTLEELLEYVNSHKELFKGKKHYVKDEKTGRIMRLHCNLEDGTYFLKWRKKK